MRKMMPVVLFVGVLLVGCRNPVMEAPTMDGVFGSAPSAIVVEVGVLSDSPVARQSCGELAWTLRTEAGCYNRNNAHEAPILGGACQETYDCACCFLYGIPPGASPEFLESLVEDRSEEVHAPLPTTIPTEVKEVGVLGAEEFPAETAVPRKKILSDLFHGGPRSWPLNKGLVVTGILLIPLIVSVVLIETETLGGTISLWLPFAAIGYVVFFGALVTHIWFPFIGINAPVPGNPTVATGIKVALLAVLAIGGYLVKSEQVSFDSLFGRIWISLDFRFRWVPAHHNRSLKGGYGDDEKYLDQLGPGCIGVFCIGFVFALA